MKNYTFPENLDSYTLRELCVKNDWFTGGTEMQYSRLFDMLHTGASVESLAAVIWTCSEFADLDDITEQLRNVQRWPLYIDCLNRRLIECGYGETEREIIRQAITTHPDAGKAFRLVFDDE